MIVGAVGALQIDVMRERIKTEYGLDVTFEVPTYQTARWIAADDEDIIKAFVDKNVMTTGTDVDDAPVLLAKSAWDIGYAQEKNPDLRFLTTKERA
jgi:peptide chain release factor 3